MLYVVLLYTILFIFFIATDYIKPWKKYHLFCKTLNSIGFILTSTWAMFQSGHTAFYFAMLPAFLFCLAGDFFLAVDSPRYKDQFFIAGLLSFLVGHICFLWTYHLIAPVAWYDFLFPIAMVFVTSYIIRKPGMHMNGASIPVMIYSFFVTMLFSKSVTMAFTTGFTHRNLLLMIGSFFFLISDFVLMFNIFYIRKFKWGPFLCGIFYYYGMFLLALSIMA